MNLYRLMVWYERDEETIEWNGLKITKKPVFIKTPKTLDIDAMFEDGISVKPFDSLPAHIKVWVDGSPPPPVV